MRVSDFVKANSLEWQGTIASVVTLSEDGDIDTEQVLSYLEDMKGKIEGVILDGDLGHSLSFIKQVKSMGYRIRAVTRGEDPDTLDDLIGACYIDSVLMYLDAEVTADALRTISIIFEYGLEHEFRTVLDSKVLCKDDVPEIAKRIRGAKRYTLVMPRKDAFKKKDVLEATEAAKRYVKNVGIRQ